MKSPAISMFGTAALALALGGFALTGVAQSCDKDKADAAKATASTDGCGAKKASTQTASAKSAAVHARASGCAAHKAALASASAGCEAHKSATQTASAKAAAASASGCEGHKSASYASGSGCTAANKAGYANNCERLQACSVDFGMEKATASQLDVYFKEKEQDGVALAGVKLPAFYATSLEGAKVSSKDLKGKPTVLVLLATHCGHSYQSLPILNRHHSLADSKHLERRFQKSIEDEEKDLREHQCCRDKRHHLPELGSIREDDDR